MTIRFYLPGDKSGGPVRTIANIVEQLGDEFDFKIITSDRDSLDEKAYPNIDIDAWNQVGKAEVFYLSPENQTLQVLTKLVCDTPHDTLYFNSFFDHNFTIKLLWARRLGHLPRKTTIIAPRGEFSPGALLQKRLKKLAYIYCSTFAGLHSGLIWHASTERESSEIDNGHPGNKKQILIAPDLAAISQTEPVSKKLGSTMKIVFLSRISAKKHLDYALKVLKKVTTPVEFNIYGPIEDPDYWNKCESLIKELPSNISVKYNGIVEHSEVPVIMASQDLFFFPTLGENFGHVIAEALLVGTPVLIANTTPWRGLEQAEAGWDLPLTDEVEFSNRINDFSNFSEEKVAFWRKKTRTFGLAKIGDPKGLEANRVIFASSADF